MKKKNKTHRRVGGIMNRTDIPFAKRLKMQHNSAIVANREHSAQVTMFCMCGALHKVHGIGYKRLVRYSLTFKKLLDEMYEDVEVGMAHAKQRLAQHGIEIFGELFSVKLPGASAKEQQIQDHALQASQIAQVVGTVAMNQEFGHSEKRLMQTLEVFRELTAQYAKEGDGFLYDMMTGIGFKIIDGKVSAFMGDDGNPVTYNQAVKDGILDGHKDVKKWAKEEKTTQK